MYLQLREKLDSDGFHSYVLVRVMDRSHEICCASALRGDEGLVLQIRDGAVVKRLDYFGSGSPEGIDRALYSIVMRRVENALNWNHDAVFDDCTRFGRKAC